MKTSWMILIMACLLVVAPLARAQMFQTVEENQAQLLQSGPGRLYCPSCGMNLITFYKTSHALGEHQYCSLHCAVKNNEDLEGLQVVDCASLKFIPAAEAFYVVGSEVKGTMTMTSKYAFADQAAAEKFARQNGGQLMNLEEAEAVARQALAKEIQMIAKKREGVAEKGQKIFASLCDGADLPAFSTVVEAKIHLAQVQPCGELTDKQCQAVAIYLVNQARMGPGAEVIEVPEKAKCPVCGMYAALYPNWTAEVKTDGGELFYFDGVKDMMKFVLEPERYHGTLTAKNLSGLRVSDYYDLKAVDAHEAWYVVGSNVFGPMGNELIPFRTREEAESFLKDHAGQTILGFDQITLEVVHGLDK